MTSTDTDEYPSWKKALFGQETIANLRCAVKYIFWHTAHLVLAIPIVISLGLLTLVDKAANTGTASVAREKTDNEYLKSGAYYLMWALVIGYLAIGVAMIAVEIYANPMIAVFILAVIGGVVVLGLTVALTASLAGEQFKAFGAWVAGLLGSAGHRATQTPGVRRVYGNCPVSFKIDPKWYESLMERFEPEYDD